MNILDQSLLIKAAQELINNPNIGTFSHAEIHIQEIEGYTLKVVIEKKHVVNALELLAKYRQHVLACVESDFLNRYLNFPQSDVLFTPDEIKILEAL